MDGKDSIRHLFLDFMQMTEFAKNPLIFREGDGIRLTDDAGRQYIDGSQVRSLRALDTETPGLSQR